MSYSESQLAEIIERSAREYKRRLIENRGRQRIPEPTFSRHVNPNILEEVRSVSRSSDSIWGNVIQLLAYRMAVARYGEGAPQVFPGAGLRPDEATPFSRTPLDKQFIAHRVDRIRVERAINGACAQGETLDRAFETFERLKRVPPLVDALMFEEVDLLYRDDVGVVRVFEVKASGNLDSKNGPANARQVLIKAVLAGADAAPAYGIAQRELAGGTAGRDLPGYTLGRRAFWEALLPAGTSFEEFDRTFERVGQSVKSELTEWFHSAMAA